MNHFECQLHYSESRREGWDHWESIYFLLNEFCRRKEAEIKDDLITLYCDLYEDDHFGCSATAERIAMLRTMSIHDLHLEVDWLRHSIRTSIQMEEERMQDWMEAEERWEREEKDRAENDEWELRWEHHYRRLCR